MFNLKQFSLIHTAAVAFGVVAFAAPAAHAMPADPVSASAPLVAPGVATQRIAAESTAVTSVGPRLTPFSGSDASQLTAAPASDRSDAAQVDPVKPYVYGGRLSPVSAGQHGVSEPSDIKWTTVALTGALILLAGAAAAATRSKRTGLAT
ncbi:MAG: hypothetical protein QOI80_3150 [Solirubrobacteraceae bacterium]|jgi:hypothetical protein|nr:hypothetical protein [Solirubrobacteraceae bacterium]